MKIILGEFKGRNFYRPADIRPTQNITRKALFDLIGHDLEGVEFLELFAGSGAIGLEALSLGAKKVTFVEKEPTFAKIIRENINLLNITPYKENKRFSDVVCKDAFASIKQFASQGRRFHVIFIDPPYARGQAKKALKTLEAYDILHPNCTVIIQHDKKETLPDVHGRFFNFRRQKYGATFLSLYRISD